MRTCAILSSVLACVALFVACGGGSDPEPEPAEQNSRSIADLPEHKTSPLAQLMREMTAFGDTTRARLLRGEDLPPYPVHFKDMLTLESTPGMVDHTTYDPFAIAYLYQLDSLYKVPVAERQQGFDELIQYCAACHGEVCPGPLVRINKLRMPG
ncbi:MAG: hypothetical protein JST41_13995 [Bacteroidetes bacterium]|jgi:hypothetical protein|nr:hypothetical protein [Bacteroidota bacterium]MBX7130246.1 hypothetical protein [Flavobacteriales bacterium]MCC6654686.1 hypothetical protein [Flavobacteriales bacterium]HMU12964.1 hypothetical protein [Flavobacteriales bacterium]HNA32098.1 hypothetical protein [Flavobacteriales bacterium]